MSTTLWHRSGTPQFRLGKVELAIGAKVVFYAAGSTTPLAVYQDAEASVPHDVANLVTNGDGVWPEIHVAYGNYRYQILDSNGTNIAFVNKIQNPAPVDPSATDPNAQLQTGDVIWKPGAVIRPGFARCNGRTLGAAGSAATERANADTLPLFSWLWNNLADAQAPVSGGRGSTAAADFAANKVITLPDLRGSGPLGLDDMGNSAAGRLDAAPVEHGGPTLGGSVVGGNTQTLVVADLPSHSHEAGTLAADSAGSHTHDVGSIVAAGVDNHTHGVTDPGHVHQIKNAGADILIQAGATGVQATGGPGQMPSSQTYGQVHGNETFSRFTGISLDQAGGHTHSLSGNTASDGAHAHGISGSTSEIGSGSAHNILSRSVLGTYLIKL